MPARRARSRACSIRTLAPFDPPLLVVTDRQLFPAPSSGEVFAAAEWAALEAITAAAPGALQLREKHLPGGRLLARAEALVALCAAHDVKLLVNDRADVARLASAAGVHLPAAAMAVEDARRGATFAQSNRRVLVGRSVHHPEEARLAAAEGADYVVFGPIFDTPSKRGFGPPQGLERLGEVCRSCPIPVIAIGGISVETVPLLVERGAAGIAVLRAVLAAASPGAATLAFREALRAAGVCGTSLEAQRGR